MKNNFLAMLAVAILYSCSTDSIKEKINKAGDVAGQTAGEFIEGAAKGVQKAFDVKVKLPTELKEKGIEFGKATISSDSSGSDNVLNLYLIFHLDYEGKLTVKAFDEKNLEMGRTSLSVSGKKDEARFFEFHFDKRTNIDSKNTLTIE
jgi:hypothetical protein